MLVCSQPTPRCQIQSTVAFSGHPKNKERAAEIQVTAAEIQRTTVEIQSMVAEIQVNVASRKCFDHSLFSL